MHGSVWGPVLWIVSCHCLRSSVNERTSYTAFMGIGYDNSNNNNGSRWNIYRLFSIPLWQTLVWVCYPSKNQKKQGTHWSPLFVAIMTKKTNEIALKAIHKTKGCAVIPTETASKRHYKFIPRRRMTELEGERWTKQQYRKPVCCLSPQTDIWLHCLKSPFIKCFHTKKFDVQAVNGLVIHL